MTTMRQLFVTYLERLADRVVCHWVGIASVGLGAVGLLNSMDQGRKANNAQDSSSAYYDTLAQISNEDYQTWKSEGLPLLQSLKTQAMQDRTAQEQDIAAGQTKDQFAAARAEARRQLNLTTGPNSDRAAAVLAPSYMDEAAQVSKALTDTRRAEQQRQFEQGAQVLNVYRGFPAQAEQGLGTAAAGQGAIAGQRSQNAAQAAYGGVLLGANAARWYGSPGGGGSTPAPAPYPTAASDISLTADPYAGYSQTYRDGGAIRTRYADGGDVGPAGVLRGPGTGTSDSIPKRVRPGSYVLSADTVRAIGHKKVHQMIEQSGVRPGEGSDYDGVPIRASNGEAIMPPETVRYHGEEFFNKMQQKYHRPVMADEDGHANGGVIRKRGLPKIVEDAIFHSMPEQAIGRRSIRHARS